MPTSISNPASFSSVRTAFNTEGYGISNSLFAYRQGGGIVPATSPFNAIGAGTAGDPLQLSQFSGFSVPSLGPTVSLFDYTLEAYSIMLSGEGGSSTAAIRLNTDGSTVFRATFGAFDSEIHVYVDNIEVGTSGGNYSLGNWLTSGNAGDVSVYAVKGIGDALGVGSSATDEWLPLTTQREWNVRAPRSSGTVTRYTPITLTFAPTTNTSNVLDTATIYLNAVADTFD
jgi:hypothetical protein